MMRFGHARILRALMVIYGAASLLHFVHNAVYIREYPNLPKWLTSPGVYATWLWRHSRWRNWLLSVP